MLIISALILVAVVMWPRKRGLFRWNEMCILLQIQCDQDRHDSIFRMQQALPKVHMRSKWVWSSKVSILMFPIRSASSQWSRNSSIITSLLASTHKLRISAFTLIRETFSRQDGARLMLLNLRRLEVCTVCYIINGFNVDYNGLQSAEQIESNLPNKNTKFPIKRYFFQNFAYLR